MAKSGRSRAKRKQRQLDAAIKEGTLTITPRDPNALIAKMHGGSGRHTDRKKEASRKACRKPVGFFCAAAFRTGRRAQPC